MLDREGNIYLENNATSYQALTPDTAYVMNRLLKNVLFSSVGTASGRYPNSNGMEAFGKTGTASDEKDLCSWAAHPTMSPLCGGDMMHLTI